jgi:hypothetical protein
MENRSRNPAEVGRAARIIVERARVYPVRGKYRSLRVFSKNMLELELLRDVFGGNWYVHGTGYIWAAGKDDDVDAIQSRARELCNGQGQNEGSSSEAG